MSLAALSLAVLVVIWICDEQSQGSLTSTETRPQSAVDGPTAESMHDESYPLDPVDRPDARVSASVSSRTSQTAWVSPTPIVHPWESIGGLATPDPYPDANAILGSPAFNPSALSLTEAQFDSFARLLAGLNDRLQEKTALAQFQLGEAVSWKIDLGMTETGTQGFGHPDLGCANIKRLTRDGTEYIVKVGPGEFASLDLACQDARIEALDGERRLQQFFADLE